MRASLAATHAGSTPLNARPFVASSKSTLVLSALAFFFLMTAYYIIRPVRDQLSGAVGSQSLPLFYLAVFVVMLALTPVFGALVARFRRKQLLGWSYCFFIACLLAFVPAFMAQDRIGARSLGVVFYVWVSIFNLFVVSLFWSFMADIFNGEQARSVFPLIALGGMAGAIFGPLVTKVLVQTLGVAPLLIVSAFTLALSLGVLLFLSGEQDRAGDRQGEPIGGSLWAGVKELVTKPFLRYMAVLMLLGDGIGTLAYALLADYSKAHFTDKVARTSFYNDLDLYANILGVALQLTITRWLMMRRGAVAALVITALVNLLLLVAVVLWGPGELHGITLGLPLLAILMIGTRGFTYGMTKPASDSLYTRVPRETRYKGKNFIETAVWRLGDVLVTSGVSLFGTLGVGVAAMAGFGVGVSALSAWVARQIGRAPDLTPETAAQPPVARRA